MTHAAKILADSISPDGVRLTTFEICFPRIILAEWNTHRMFCLAGDTELEFDLPGGQKKGRRVHKMRLDEFVDKWLYGARRAGAKPKRKVDVSWAEPGKLYEAPEVASRLGMASAGNINTLCRRDDLLATKSNDGTWLIDGAEIKRWRESVPEHTRFDMRSRLGNMRIRQLNEDTGDIQFSYIKGVSCSGFKQVYEVQAGEFSVTGSADHLVFTHEGWKTIRDIKPGDFLIVRKFGKRNEDKLDPLRLKKINGAWRSVWQRRKREELYEKDKMCRRCRVTVGETIHHIVPVHEDPSRAFDEENITLLCDDCHTEEHRTQGWQGGTYLYGSAAQVTSIVPRGEEETYDLEIAGEYPNFLANGVVVHNSRNSASSRAIPVKKMLKRVKENPYVPSVWGKNQRGMQAGEEVDEQTALAAKVRWLQGRDKAMNTVQHLLELGIHKQLTNRLLEPWLWHTVICTATEWSNFFNLRNNSAAHPDIQKPAALIQELYEGAEPMELKYGQWHLPLVVGVEFENYDELPPLPYWDLETMVKISCARCARVSYLTHDGKRDLEKDLELYDNLLQPGHMSPFEHAARPMTGDEYERYHRIDDPEGVAFCGNFNMWLQHRKLIPGEADIFAHRKTA